MISISYLVVCVGLVILLLLLWRSEKARRIRVEDRLVIFERIIRLDEQIDQRMKGDPHWAIRPETRQLVDERVNLHRTLEGIIQRRVPRDSAYVQALSRSVSAVTSP